MAILHPSTEQFDLANVLSALGDATRLAMVHQLAERDELSAGAFKELGSKTVLSYHMAKLREAGLIKVRAQSTRRFVSLRRDDLESRFPGLLATIMPRRASVGMSATAVSQASAVLTAAEDDWID